MSGKFYANRGHGERLESARAKENGKQAKHEVKYEDPAKGADHCRDCVHFVVPRACVKVEGNISPAAWCELFKAKEGAS